MAQTCGKCSRINPPDAAYCYYDGSALAQTVGSGGAVAAGQRPFPSAFIFPTGRSCRTFNELAVCCQEQWQVACDLLRRGYFESFLSGLGRPDLALVARQAACFPDLDRGLDQMLMRLPATVLDPPKLLVNPLEVSLGQLYVGEERSFELHLENQGMRLLYGSVTCEECNWLGLGGLKGANEKHFQFGAEMAIPIHVQGKRLRASGKPLEGKLIVDSNGGLATVVVRADVPVKSFIGGVLAGARSPRQIAEKARQAPREAAEFFESGAVARWYADNGWSYPVTGPAPKGPAAVQQFFEVLGLTVPPKVEISENAVLLRGNVGDAVRYDLLIHNKERKAKPVFAHAMSDQPWLEVGRPQLNGRTAAIPLVVPAVPDREGEMLTARVVVVANGNQRFVIPVALAVGGNLHFSDAPPQDSGFSSSLAHVAPQVRANATPPNFLRALVEVGRLAWPVVALLVLLSAVLCYDAFHREEPESGLLDNEPRLDVRFNDTMRFGIIMLRESDPEQQGKFKRLTYKEDGETNNTCLKIDEKEILFGRSPGRWARDRKGELRKVDLKNRGFRSEWEVFPDPEQYPNSRIVVTQTVQLVPGEQTRVLDTYLVRYSVLNDGGETHRVGLRVLLDTFVGANDGSPFVIPGQPGLLQKMRRFSYKEIPDYVQALEHEDLANPGTVAHLGLKGLRIPDAGVALETPESMVICRYPGNPEVKWDWELEPIDQDPNRKDSCVALYWTVQTMNPRERREMAFSYGLNAVSSNSGGHLGLTTGGSFKPAGEFTVTAYLKNPQEGQKAKIVLPPGLEFLEGEAAEKVVEAGGEYSQVSWRVRAESVGVYYLTVSSGLNQGICTVRITEKGILD
jgi:hypothetical protein